MLYGILGGKEFLFNSQRYLERRIQLECDGEPVELPQRLQGLVFLNIPSYMAGTNFWGTEREKSVSIRDGSREKEEEWEKDINERGYGMREEEVGTGGVSSPLLFVERQVNLCIHNHYLPSMYRHL